MLNPIETSTVSRHLPEVALFAKKAAKYRQRYAHYFEEVTSQHGSTITVAGQEKLNFCTYSYLGLVEHPAVKNGAMKALLQYGCGTHGVRLLGGNLKLYRELERKIAGFCGREDAMLLTSGFLTNQTVIRALVRPGDIIFCEERNHASIIDGCKLASSEVSLFKHNEPDVLARRIAAQPCERRKLIVADAVFSMDGDILDLPEYLQIRDSFANTFLMVDEAHSIGVLGASGKGIEEHFGVAPGCGVDIKMGTLSKAIPGNGGFIAADHSIIDFLRYHTRGYIFTAALSPATAGAAIASLEVIENEGRDRIRLLWRNVNYLREALAAYDIKTTPSRSPITGVLIGNEDKAFDVSRVCFDNGLFVLPVAYPAVPRGSERIRLNVHCDHSLTEIDSAVSILACALQEVLNKRSRSQSGAC